MKLYFAPRTRAVRARWLLEELELPYELVKVDVAAQEHRTPDFLALSPFGELPVLVDGKIVLSDSPSILLHLGDKSPEKKLAPAVGTPERAAYYQWLLFAETVADPVLMEFHRHALLPEPQKAQHEPAMARHRARLEEVLEVVERRIAGRECVAGYDFTAADLALTSVLHIGTRLELLGAHPRVVEYVHRHSKRNAVLRAMS